MDKEKESIIYKVEDSSIYLTCMSFHHSLSERNRLLVLLRQPWRNEEEKQAYSYLLSRIEEHLMTLGKSILNKGK